MYEPDVCVRARSKICLLAFSLFLLQHSQPGFVLVCVNFFFQMHWWGGEKDVLSSSFKGWEKGTLGNMAGVFTSPKVGKNLQTARVNVSGNREQGGMKVKGINIQAATLLSELLKVL